MNAVDQQNKHNSRSRVLVDQFFSSFLLWDHWDWHCCWTLVNTLCQWIRLLLTLCIPWKNTSYVVLSHILLCQTCTLTFESWPMCIGFKFPLFIPISNITQSSLCTLLMLTFLAPRKWVLHIPTSQIAFLVSINGTKCIIYIHWSLIS
jgi:hypothetical protein